MGYTLKLTGWKTTYTKRLERQVPDSAPNRREIQGIHNTFSYPFMIRIPKAVRYWRFFLGRTGVLILMETALCLIEANQPIYPLDLTRWERERTKQLLTSPPPHLFLSENNYILFLAYRTLLWIIKSLTNIEPEVSSYTVLSLKRNRIWKDCWHFYHVFLLLRAFSKLKWEKKY